MNECEVALVRIVVLDAVDAAVVDDVVDAVVVDAIVASSTTGSTTGVGNDDARDGTRGTVVVTSFN